MLTTHTISSGEKTVIIEETKDGKVIVKGVQGTEVVQYIKFKTVDAIPGMIEYLQEFLVKYKENNAVSVEETPRRIDIDM